MNVEETDQLNEAIQLFWSFKLQECEKILLKYNDRLPLFALLYADISFIKCGLTETKEDSDEASKRIGNAKKLAREQQLSQKPLYIKQEKDEKKNGSGSNGATADSQVTKAQYLIAKLVYAESLVMKGILEFKAQNNIKAGLSFRKSWKQFSQAFEVVQALPSTFPAYQHIASASYYGVGIFHFLVSAVPPQYVWLVEGIGFKANRMEGVKEIKIAADITYGIRSIMAKCCYALLYCFFFEDFETPKATIDELLERYPDGAMINYMSGAIQRKKGNTAQSSIYYNNALKNSTELKQLQLFIESELGYNEFLNLNWAAAEQHLSLFLQGTTSKGFKAFIAYQLACCYEMQDNRDKAMETMRTIDSCVRKGYDFDEFSQRKALRYIKNKQLNAFEREYLKAALLNEAHLFEESNQVLQAAITLPGLTSEEISVAEYMFGFNDQQLGKSEEAKKHYMASLSREKQLSYDHFIIPYASVGLAELMLAEEKKTECRAYIKKAKSYTSNAYDFPSMLDWRARKCLQALGEF
ncbi:hypothetical protein SAMD00019534_118510 [Acytostelium subglobosum LB1]|uniref:hypothetical protein n=1 Tax=Acytostelium subglobosum LB1 TaxID=1410327 RepID=UPI0006448E30|nr:hypothetical protein SAMD00019534_118510 [Acytostelium subglobosum LB1]GAM28675.1 hypothetical protein SAMD00019534_118510 [Acytostelium subglobosum LB1]|eukprot:XP_012748453.1 hypothetical protein SAMD00019534_118510 [Acytostelium subglobosum LB1]